MAPMFFNLPTLMTWARIVAIPLIVGVFYLPLDPASRNLIATVMFVVFAATDWADGYLARKLNQVSAFGAFLDPVADKFLICACILVLVHLGRADVFVALIIIGREIAISALREWMAQFLDPVADKFLICACILVLVHLGRADVFVALLIIGREIAISALREWMAQLGAARSVAVHMIGKLKTVVQMVAIGFLLFDGRLFGIINTHVWGVWLIWIAAVMTVWSMVYYLQKALPEIRARAK